MKRSNYKHANHMPEQSSRMILEIQNYAGPKKVKFRMYGIQKQIIRNSRSRKIQSKLTVKLTMGVNFHDLGSNSSFLDMIPKHKQLKEKKRQIRLKIFTLQDTIKKVKRQV